MYKLIANFITRIISGWQYENRNVSIAINVNSL